MSLVDTTVAEAKAPGATPLPAEPRYHGWRLLLRDRTAAFGLVVFALLTLAAVFAPVLARHNPDTVDILGKNASPSLEHPLGTDNLGRDTLARVLFGARLTIGTAVLASAAVAVLGTFLGVLAGFVGGAVDAVIGRLVDIVLAFPPFLVALAVTAALGPGLGNVAIALICVWWARYARIVRSAVIAERAKPYLEAARAAGASRRRIVRRHVLPNIIAPVVVLTTLDTGDLLIAFASLSFLGLGVSPPTAEWGAMLAEGRAYLSTEPLLMVWPGLALFLLVLALNLLGDGLRDVLDPRTRRGRR